MFACRLIDKVYRLGHKIYIHTAGEDQAKLLDDKLWTFREDSFLPHTIVRTSVDAEPAEKEVSPIRIGFDHEPDENQEVLINLSGEVPLFSLNLTGLQRLYPLTKIADLAQEKTTPSIRIVATH